MSTTLIVEHPTAVHLPRVKTKDKRVSLSLNDVLNLHYQDYQSAKKLVKGNIEKYLTESGQDGIIFTKPVDVTFKLYKKTRIRTDKANFSGGACKFIYDALVELSVLVDDNDDWILTEHLLETEHDKDNPRVVLTFKEREGNEHI